MATVNTNKKDLRMDQGDTWITKWQVKDYGLDVPAPVDITSATIWFTAKADIDDVDASASFQKTSASGISITDATNGKFTVTVAASDTSGLTGFLYQEKRLAYDLQVKTAAGQIFTVARGALVVKQQVTISTS